MKHCTYAWEYGKLPSCTQDCEGCIHYDGPSEEEPDNISIEFTPEEYEAIETYKKAIQASTIQVAVMNAISLALDNGDWNE